ncbi:MAG: DUF4038 domain-containing protein [Cyanobacteriota bacterium]|nr:DUF4038 domain-containing protein [Cyanobacteriota bacterium]
MKTLGFNNIRVRTIALTIAACSLTIGCRQTSNPTDPESAAPSNRAPVVSAGSQQTVSPTVSVNLDGTVSDDDLPSTSLTLAWEQVDGPGNATFADATQADTTVEFPEAGTYVLRLSADDGEKTSSDEVTIAVNATGETQVPSLGLFEQAFTTTGDYGNPYAEVTATATFTAPDGTIKSIPLFWDGGDRWKVRFSPNGEGTWQWNIESNDRALNGQSGSFTSLKSDLPGGVRVRASHPHHFEREDGTPFWLFGDTNWSLVSTDDRENLDREAVKHYIDVRAEQQFNYIHTNLLVDDNDGGAAFKSYANETINPAFWQEVDARLQYAHDRDIMVMLFLAWAKDGAVGDWRQFPSDEARLRYARYIVARYSAYNVAFNVAGEWNEYGPKSMYQDLANEIVRSDPHDRTIGIHPGEASFSVAQFATEDWMSFSDFQQSYRRLRQRVLDAREQPKPVINSEYAYYLRDKNGDGRVDKPNSRDVDDIRHASWDIAMAGGYFVTGWGTTYFGGRRDPDTFNVDTPRNDDWEEQVQHVKTFFTGLNWWELEPVDDRLEGRGTKYLLANPGEQYAVYVRDANGEVSLTLDAADNGKTYSIRQFDPRSGEYTNLDDATAGDAIVLTPPDEQDWLFVLDRKGN